jgi:hypothetical protein
MRRPVLPWIGLAALVASLILPWPAPSAEAAPGIAYYLEGNSSPTDGLSTTAPTAGTIPDPDDDNKPGRTLDKTDKGMSENNENKYQQWETPVTALVVTGSVTLDLWAAPRDFKTDKTATITAYLLDCGLTCTVLATTSATFGPGNWQHKVMTFPSITHTFLVGRRLGLRLVAPNTSQENAWVAYDAASYPSRLEIPQLLGTTTTTSSTTTTTVPVTTTLPTITTTAPAIPTTSIAIPTTTSPTLPTGGPTTTEGGGIVIIPGQGGGGSGTSTTTSTIPGGGEPEPEVGPVDVTVPADAPPVEVPVEPSSGTEKDSLVVTTPSRGLLVALPAAERLSPQEGLMVAFLSAAETVRSQLLASIGLGTLAAMLLLVGSRRWARNKELEETAPITILEI